MKKSNERELPYKKEGIGEGLRLKFKAWKRQKGIGRIHCVIITQVEWIIWHELLKVAFRETANEFGNQLCIRVGEKFERVYYKNAYDTFAPSSS